MKSLLDEYKKTENKEFLIQAINIQINEIYPEIRNRRMLQNELVELDVKEKEIKLFKYPIVFSKLYSNLGENPRVIKFSMNKDIEEVEKSKVEEDEFKYYDDDDDDYRDYY